MKIQPVPSEFDCQTCRQDIGVYPLRSLTAFVTLIGAIPAVILAAKGIAGPRRFRLSILLRIVTHLFTGLLIAVACVSDAHGKM